MTTAPLNGSSNSQHEQQQRDAIFSSAKEAQTHLIERLSQNGNEPRPPRRQKLVKCGELACQRDSYLQSLDGCELLAVAAFLEVTAPGAGKSGKKKKKTTKKKGPDAANGAALGDATWYALVLSDSVFFPEGGGQPCDKGYVTLRMTSGDDDDDDVVAEEVRLAVSDVRNVENVCILLCRAAAAGDDDKSTAILTKIMSATARMTTPGVVTARQEIDWNRRFDLMTQHSGQHLVSAVAMNEYGIETHSFSLNENGPVSYIDVILPASAEGDESVAMGRVETEVNNLIRQNLVMAPLWVKPSDPLFRDGGVRSRLLPSNLPEGEKIRLVKIGRDDDDGGCGSVVVDLNTCCGTHVPTLGQLQMLKFIKIEKVKGSIRRVHFAAGRRLMAYLTGAFERQASVNSLLSCQEDQHVERITGLLEEKYRQEKKVKSLEERLSRALSRDVVAELKRSDCNVVAFDLGHVDIRFLTNVSNLALEMFSKELTEDGSGTKTSVLMLFVAGEEEKDEGLFLLTGEVSAVDALGRTVAQVLGGRGGGKNGKFQGKASKVRSALEDAKSILENKMKDI